jgi:hypothetical protein
MVASFENIRKVETPYIELRDNGRMRYLTEEQFNRCTGICLFYHKGIASWVIMDKAQPKKHYRIDTLLKTRGKTK